MSASFERPSSVPRVPIIEIHTARSGADVSKYDNGFYTTGNVLSKPVDFLIDCGATTSLLSSHTFAVLQKQFKITPVPVSQTFHTVNGDPMNVSSKIELSV